VSTYPTYKPSGIEWLGEIPEHWPIERLHNKCDIVRGNSSFKKDELLSKGKYVALQYGKTYKVEQINQNFNFFVNDEFYKSEQIVNYNDVIFISTSETLEDLGHSVFYNRKEIGLVGGEQIVLKPERKILDGKYLFYYSKVLGKELNKFATGVKVFRFDVNDLKTIYLPLPILSEQQSIANYLDEKTSKLDQLISNKKAQIDKLKEIRQIEINTAVTKGLDRNVKLKPSGVEWLGDIPEHWISTRVKNALVFDIGGTPARNKMEYFDGNNLWVSISDLNNQDIINDTSEKITDEAVEDSNCKLIPKGSLLFSFKLSVGHLAFAGSDLYTNEAIAAFRPSNRLNVRFLKYLLQIEFESNANTNIYGAYLFNKETLGTAKIVFPDDSKEQTAIANYLDEKTSKIDQLVHNLENQIEQLQEVRKIEIYNAVTGKIKTG
jgi:type I restriction enzyme S subunit